jgi:hypothetical protein
MRTTTGHGAEVRSAGTMPYEAGSTGGICLAGWKTR